MLSKRLLLYLCFNFWHLLSNTFKGFSTLSHDFKAFRTLSNNFLTYFFHSPVQKRRVDQSCNLLSWNCSHTRFVITFLFFLSRLPFFLRVITYLTFVFILFERWLKILCSRSVFFRRRELPHLALFNCLTEVQKIGSSGRIFF